MNKSEKFLVLAYFVGWFFGPAYFYYQKRPMKISDIVAITVIGPIATIVAIGKVAKEIGEMEI